jgi:hypothetical protein
VTAEFVFANGSTSEGFVTPATDADDIATMQPHVFVGEGCVGSLAACLAFRKGLARGSIAPLAARRASFRSRLPPSQHLREASSLAECTASIDTRVEWRSSARHDEAAQQGVEADEA